MAAKTYRIHFGHGLGDNVMLTSLLRQLRHHEPDTIIELVVAQPKVALFDGLADEVSGKRDFKRPPTHDLKWLFCERSFSDSPSTNAERALRESFGHVPVSQYWGYSVAVRDGNRELVREYLWSLPRQHERVAVLHYRGNALKDRKDLDDYQAAAIVDSLKRHGYDVLIWDANDKSDLPDEGFGIRIEEKPPLFKTQPGDCGVLAALLAESDLVVGVDSGILHLASAVGTRAIGLWKQHHPLHFFAPDGTTTHLIPKKDWHSSHRWLVKRPIDVGLEFFESHYDHRYYCDVPWCNDISLMVDEVLDGMHPTSEPVYVKSPEHDARLRNWLKKASEWMRNGWRDLPKIKVDRDRGFDFLLRFLLGCDKPTVIETGTTRMANDFGGAGSATSFFCLLAQQHGGTVHSVDLSEENVMFSQSWCREFGDSVKVHHSDSVAWLKAFDGQADLVYLDSRDLEDDGHPMHCLREAKAVAHKVRPGGLIVFDDTPEIAGEVHGKGKLAVPWLNGHGWETVHVGYQRILRKPILPSGWTPAGFETRTQGT